MFYYRLYDATNKRGDKWKILVLKIGSNDLTNETAHEFVHSLMAFLEHVQNQHGINRIVIMEILYRRHTDQYPVEMDIETYNSIVAAANQQLKTLCENSCYMDFWQHYSLQHRRFISRDGVHLTPEAVARYW